jgi:hypothetical protein
MDNLDRFAYWINERDKVRIRKEAGEPKPWSADKTFQTTYFCNVNREHDTVTKWIRMFYTIENLETDDPEFNAVFARLINWPDTLEQIGHVTISNLNNVEEALYELQRKGGKVFGNAYIVSTNGHKVPKPQHLCQSLLPAAWEAITANISTMRGGSLAAAHAALMQANGLGSFLAAQVIADLKHTSGHPLTNAEDWSMWAAPGPGSLRGLEWLELYDKPRGAEFTDQLIDLRSTLIGMSVLSDACEGWILDLQNLQNCLCEFDKYMRVSSGAGRSKRNYNGR